VTRIWYWFLASGTGLSCRLAIWTKSWWSLWRSRFSVFTYLSVY